MMASRPEDVADSRQAAPQGDRSVALVPRPRLLSRLQGTSARLVLVNAPSGYGKSVLIEQWAEVDRRPFPVLILGAEHDDPGMLVASIVAALDPIEPVDKGVGDALTGPQPDFEGVVLPRLEATLKDRRVPFVLVLDDFERITATDALAVVAAVIGALPAGSQVAVASRTEPALGIGRLRAHREVHEIGASDLVMRATESEELLTGIGLELSGGQLTSLLERTEGWPAALYLAGLSLQRAIDLDAAIDRFAGDDRIVVDYLREEFLRPMDPDRLDFLLRSSVLDRLRGDLCDEVLQSDGSAIRIRDLSRSNMLLAPLDSHDEWFRLHPLFRGMLRAELRRVEPQTEAALHRRASDWWAAQDDWDRAITHAVEGGALDRAGELLWMGIPAYATRGRNATLFAWLDRLGEQTVATDASLSLTASYAHITQGDGGRSEYWASVSAGLIEQEETSDKKTVLLAGMALIEAALARDGVGGIADRTALAAAMLPDDSPWMAMCRLIEGVGLHLQGHRDEAREKLVDGARRGAVSAPNLQVLNLAQLVLLAVEEGDWTLADMLASQARAQIDRSGIADYPTIALAFAVSGLVRSRTGRLEGAAADLRRGRQLLDRLVDFPAWYEAETLIALARTAIRLDEVPAATEMLDGASRLLRATPDAVVLGDWIAEAGRSLETVSASAVRDLTPAELRVLGYLPTHLSLSEIAEQVFVSPNTVKSQAQSVYRKLGVASRREAVKRAREAGLLDADSPSNRR
jgi:LuxR family transcriptional regulator, maltose regulon positive regulatory protein